MNYQAVISRRLQTFGYPALGLEYCTGLQQGGLRFFGPLSLVNIKRLTKRFINECSYDNVDRAEIELWYENTINDLGSPPLKVSCDFATPNSIPFIETTVDLERHRQNVAVDLIDFYEWLVFDVNKTRQKITDQLGLNVSTITTSSITASEDNQNSWNYCQRVALSSYKNGKYAHLLNEYSDLSKAVITDRLLRFVLTELNEPANYQDTNIAREHLASLVHHIEQVSNKFIPLRSGMSG